MSVTQDLEVYLSKLQREDKLAVACSAGIDSLVLLKALQELKFNPYCIHLDHGLRADSHLAREFLEKYCANHGIPFIVKEFKAGDLKTNEESAREARYDFFKEACLEHGIKNLFLAHNLNDQAETILFRIFRGTNTAGLQGIPQDRELAPGISIHRPLLKTSRQSIEEYARLNSLKFIEDSSNSDMKFSRNRIRQRILPEAEIINHQYLNHIQTLAELISEEQEFLNECTSEALANLGALPWSLESFRAFKRSIQRKILERTFTTNISFIHDFLNAINEGGFHRINFTKNKYFTIKQKQIHLEEPLDSF